MILSNIIKGGQLSMHALRMFRQVFGVLLIWIAIVSGLIFSLVVYLNTPKERWVDVCDYAVATFMDGIGLSDANIVTRNSDNRYNLRASTIVNSRYYYNETQLLLLTFKKAMTCGGIAAAIILVIAGGYFIHQGINKSRDIFKRGAKPADFDTVRWAIRNFNRKQAYDAYTIAGAPYPARGEMQHTLLIGTTGTGKTSVISDVVNQIRKRGDRAIIFDTKGCYLEWFYRQKTDHVLNPFDARSEKWNLFKEISDTSHIKSIAQAFIPEGKGSSVIWNEAARIAFSGFIEKMLPEDVTNRDVADKIMKQDVKEVVKFLKGTYAQSIVDTKAPETTGGVLFTMSSYLNSLRLTNHKKSESFSIKEWIKESSDSFLFITSRQESASDLVPLQTVWWEIAFKNLLSIGRNSSKKTWIILDEIGTLQNIPSLQETMSRTREYGCCFVLGMQDIGQLEDRYGDRVARTISTLCNTRCIFRTPDPYTANWISKNIGEQEIEQVKEGLSYGAHQMRDGVNVHKHDVIKSLVLPSEIQHLKDLELYLQFPNYPFVKTKIEWKDRLSKSKAFIENEQLNEDVKVEMPKEKEPPVKVEEKPPEKQEITEMREEVVTTTKFKI